mmetsp:Transcript_28313/g.77727  ORF Transcript_28313/g.77727 Transcript_28313/m.77727 type:complete len:594 (-) Transcript_28313:85-1866(-)
MLKILSSSARDASRSNGVAQRIVGGASATSIFRSLGSSSSSSSPNENRLLVVGSGVAGSAAALIAAETHQIPVTMIYAGNVATDCNSYWAQGGIIYRNYDPQSGDSADLLAQDIHRAGAGLCDSNAVQKLSEEGPDRVRQLLLDATERFAQVPFDRTSDGELSLCLEASHAAPRILHKADHTGRVITQHITQAAARHPLIQQIPRTVVTDLIVEDDHCIGVETLDRTTGRTCQEFGGHGTVLASGGLAGIYEHSTNPAGFNALGSSVALAARQQVVCRDLEYVQFHPTALCIPNESRFLLTEALRGEGAVLRDASGRAFAHDYHKDGELAPRDVVARAVFEESQKDSTQHNAFLDITHRDADWLRARFPSIQEHLVARGLDLANDRLPVIPAAHYTCGGIATDLQGRTSLKGLYAAGEAARTGVHGGNRLASTSLLEGLVFGASVSDFVGSEQGQDIRSQTAARIFSQMPPIGNSRTRNPASLEPLHIQNASDRAMKLLQELRRNMWDYVGVVRTPRGLETAMEELEDIRAEAEHIHATCPTLETAAVRDATCAGCVVASAANANQTSAGAHCIAPDSEVDSDEEEDAVAAAR